MERTCLVTKQKAPPDRLLRFTIRGGQLKFDGETKAEGRGGYVVREVTAIEKLPKLAGKLAHFLKVKRVELSEAEVERGKQIIGVTE